MKLQAIDKFQSVVVTVVQCSLNKKYGTSKDYFERGKLEPQSYQMPRSLEAAP